MNQWQQVIDDELVACHIYQKHHDTDPKRALNDIIAWHVQVALDPQVSSDAQALIDNEREAIAKLFDGPVWGYDYREIAARIRARGEK